MPLNSQNIFPDLEKYKKKIAIYENQNQIYTYGDIIEFGKKFKFLNKKKSLILILSQNSYETISAYINFIKYNQTVFLLSQDLEEKFFLNIISKYKPKFIFLSKKNNFKKFTKLYKIRCSLNKSLLYELKKDANYQINKNLALLLMTSGTTGNPQTVRISYSNLKSNTKTISNYFNIKPSDRAITTLPMNYTLGLSIINTHFAKGASITLTDYSLMQKEFWNLLGQNKITTFTGVPFTFEILRRVISEKNNLENLKYVTQAGGKLDLDIVKYFENFFSKKKIKFYIMYGQTEATARMSILNYKELKKNPQSIGKVIKGGKFMIIDENGNLIKKDGKIGELIYKGKNVSLGYARNFFDLKKNDENKGILKTGDLSYKKNNLYYLVGRKKRFLKINGVRTNLDDIEKIFKQKKIDCVCKGQDDNLEAYFLKSQFSENIIKRIFKKLKIRERNIRMYKIEKIPRNESGKVIYKSLIKNDL